MTTALPALTLLSRFGEHVERQPTRTAFTFLGDEGAPPQSLTYAQLAQQVQAAASALTARLRPHDRVLLLLPNGADFIPTFLACLEAGVIAVPAYPPLPVRSRQRVQTLRAIVEDCQPAAVVTAAPPEVVDEVRTAVPELAGAWWALADELISTPGVRPVPSRVEPTNVAFLQYTSGSTGAPRGVVVGHRALVHNEELIRTLMGHTSDLRMSSWLPLFHDMGLIGTVLQPLWMGGQSVLMSPTAFIKRPIRWLRAISDHRITTSGGPNFGYDLCLRRVRDDDCAGLDLSSWRVAFNGAEPVRADTMRAFAERFAAYGFDPAASYPCYGMAETTLMVTGCQLDRVPSELTVDRAALGSGRIVPDAAGQTLVSSGVTELDRTLLIVDPETLRPLPDDRVGEIWVGGPDLPAGYWGNAAATKQTFAARPVGGPEQPYLRTGDLGFRHDGELYITGRIKDVVIVGGRNHYPHDIEATVEDAHGAVRRGCAAAFSYDDRQAERVVVVVGVGQIGGNRANSAGKRAEIVGAIRAAVASGHGLALDDIVLVGSNAVPKTSSGKLRRGACRDAYLAGEYADRDSTEQETA